MKQPRRSYGHLVVSHPTQLTDAPSANHQHKSILPLLQLYFHNATLSIVYQHITPRCRNRVVEFKCKKNANILRFCTIFCRLDWLCEHCECRSQVQEKCKHPKILHYFLPPCSLFIAPCSLFFALCSLFLALCSPLTLSSPSCIHHA